MAGRLKGSSISVLAGSLALASGFVSADPPRYAAQSGLAPSSQSRWQAQPPSEDEIRTRAQKLLANQHADDEALDLYERVERHIDRSGGANPHTLDDKTFRVVPTGGGTEKILLSDQGKPTDPAEYSQQLKALEETLQMMSNPNDSRAKSAYAKYEKRKNEHAEFVDAANEAYGRKWIGRENRNGRDCNVFELDPSPDFQPHSMFQSALTHIRAKIWVDRETNQLVRGEANVISDVSFGGGILGKLYRGSFVAMDQAEVAPGIWLATRYQYDYAGRKFLFSFGAHQVIEVSHYRRVGPPKEALQLVQSEVTSGKTFSEDPQRFLPSGVQ